MREKTAILEFLVSCARANGPRVEREEEDERKILMENRM